MEPTPALIDIWNNAPDGEERRKYYYSAGESFQRVINSIANATENELHWLYEFLKSARQDEGSGM